MVKNGWSLSTNLVAADVSPLILHWRSLSRLTSAATSPNRFRVSMHFQKEIEAFHEPLLVWSPAFRRLERLGPAKAGTPSCQRFHGPNARSQNRGGFP